MQFLLPQLHEPLILWERIEIDVNEGAESGQYVARIEDFVAGGIVISTPEFVRGSTLLRENSEVTVVITREDAVYLFNSSIRQIRRHQKRSYQLTLPKNIQRIQRRQFVRIGLNARALYVNLTADQTATNDSGQFKWWGAKVIDISGGGMLMKVHEGLHQQDLLLLKVPFLAEIGLPETTAGICRRVFSKRNEVLAGIEFITSGRLAHYFNQGELMNLPQSIKDFDRAAQNRLAAYVFNQQIELRKKGLL